MERHELIITTAKEIFLKFGVMNLHQSDALSTFDKDFKAIVKTISESFKTIGN